MTSPTSPVTTLKFTKSVSPQQAKVGETFTFQISVQNRGTVTLNNVRMSDVFPEQLNLTSATTSRGTAQLSTSTREVQITIPTLNGGEERYNRDPSQCQYLGRDTQDFTQPG